MPIQRRCANPACQQPFAVPPSVVVAGRGRYCGQACRWAHVTPPQPTEERFWDSVQVCRHGRDCLFCCWPWQGTVHHKGYGVFKVKTAHGWTRISAHRYAWSLLNGQPLPPGIEARHWCGQLACVNGIHVHPGCLPIQVREAIDRMIAAGRLRLPGWKHAQGS